MSDRRPYRKLRKVAIGDQVNKWTAISTAFIDPNTKHSLVRIRCECGTEKVTQPAQFWGGYSRSCMSCANKARSAKPNKYPFVVNDAAAKLGTNVQAIYRMIYKEGAQAVQRRLIGK